MKKTGANLQGEASPQVVSEAKDNFRKDDDVKRGFRDRQQRQTPEVMLENTTIRRALPGQLFSSTQIPVCLWFVEKNKNANAKRGFRDRRQQILVTRAKPVLINFSNN